MNKSIIKSIDVDESMEIFTVNYYSGRSVWYTIKNLPNTAIAFLQDRKDKPEKAFKKVLPKFGPGKNNYNIIGEFTYYVIMD